jgi:hypothetical protein
MSRRIRIVLMALPLVATLPLAGCETSDIVDKVTDLEWLNPKKKLPGDRRPVFPEGVPGVQQGVPAELQKGYQPAPEPQPEVAEDPETARMRRAAENQRNPHADATAPRPQRTATRPKPKPRPPVEAGDDPPAAQQQPQRAQTAPWPGQAQQNSQGWPSSPAPGTFSR